MSNVRHRMAAPLLYTGPGVYIVTLTNQHPISVNADRPRIAERCIQVTQENCKFGKALNLHVRRANYFKTFGEQFVRFHALASVAEPHVVEAIVARQLLPYRVRGVTGRLNEWLIGITPHEVEVVVLAALNEAGIPYTLLGRVEP